MIEAFLIGLSIGTGISIPALAVYLVVRQWEKRP